ncbi:ubiquitin homeostasis protein lub1 [Echria macrotheca]|uniref:Ubiquitin homeostasis protein lub1 n=1 Tax=Echria macrotheca TaxID=438768 RepID=A0AAJ0BHV2_9PEZI|nr:ubiquitin homeostasis protein lub1 [Echria macrotheca]
MSQFQLSAQLKGHNGDVRAVVFPTADLIVSGSRDNTARVWRKTAPKPPKFEDTIISQTQGFVNSVAFLHRPGSSNLVVQSGADGVIEVQNPDAPRDDSRRVMVGHTNNVCALDTSPDGRFIVSGGWDGKAFVWGTDKWEATHQLAHAGDGVSVWAVLAFSNDVIVTGSADHEIRIFNLKSRSSLEIPAQRTMKTGDVVRALCKLPTDLKGKHPSGAQFASGGNDAVIRLWKLDGQQVGRLDGHDSFIYSLASLPTGEIVSAGEDRTMRIWRGRECVQVITHPAISVWSVAVCSSNGDIVSGASDNIVRVFSRNHERVAGPETIEEFEQSLRASAIPSSSVNQQATETPEWLRLNKGTKDGQIKLIKEDDGSVSAYQWSSGRDWVQIGTVVEPETSQRPKVLYKGKEYDYVFDVDTEEGRPPLKLPYNLSDDMYQAATKFLADNELPISYLEAVAGFIRDNTKDATPGRSQAAPPAQENTTRSVATYLPHTEYLGLTQARLEPALRKLKEFNSAHIESGNKHISMNPDNVASLDALVQALGASQKPIPSPQVSARIVSSIITQWPYGNRLPALDILRCMVAKSGVASLADGRQRSLLDIAVRGALDTADPITDTGASLAEFIADGVNWDNINPNNAMMAFRAVVNLFLTPEGRELAIREAAAIVSLMARIAGVDGKEPVGGANNNLQVALVTAAFNYACFAYNERRKSPAEEALDLGLLTQLFSVAEAVIRKQNDAEVLFRACMTAGMVIASGDDGKELAKALAVGEWLGVATKNADPRIKAVVAECSEYLKG